MRLLVPPLTVLLTLGCSENATTAAIELTRRVMITGVGDSVDLGWGGASLSSNGFIAVRRLEPPSDAVAIYDSTGTYVHTIGRAGGGPGEFGSVSTFGFGPGDSLWVVDGLSTAQVFTPPPASRYARSIHFDRPVSATLTTHGILAFPMVSMGSYLPPRLLSWDGAELARFVPPDNGGATDPEMGPVSLVAADLAWVARELKYEVMLIGSDGAVRGRVTRNAVWFPEGSRLTAGMPFQKPPPPRIHSIVIGPDSLLWVLVRRAHRNWEANKAKAAPTDQPITPRALGAFKIADLFEGVIEVLDPASGDLLASREVGGGMLGFVKPGILWEQIELESGARQIQLWDVRISR